MQSSAITEAKLKMSDVGCALHICSLMHQRYADFTKTLFENWHRILMGTKKDEKVTKNSAVVSCGQIFDKLKPHEGTTLYKKMAFLITCHQEFVTLDGNRHIV